MKTYQSSQPNNDGQVFTVGQGVHFHFNGDSYPGTVESITWNGRKITVRQDRLLKTERNDHGDIVNQEFEPNPNVSVRVFMLNKDKMFSDGVFVLYPNRRMNWNPHF